MPITLELSCLHLTNIASRKSNTVERSAESEDTWMHNVGIKSVSFDAGSTGRKPQPPFGPEGPFVDHLRNIFLIIHKIRSPNEWIILWIHIIRTSFLEIGYRASDHSRVMYVQPDRDRKPKNEKKKIQSKSENQSQAVLEMKEAGSKPKGFDYRISLLPSHTEGDNSENIYGAVKELFRGNSRLAAIHSNSVLQLQAVAQNLDEDLQDLKLEPVIAESEWETEARSFCADRFKTSIKPTSFGDLHRIIGSLMLTFLSGIHTLITIYHSKRQKDLWEEFSTKSLEELGRPTVRGITCIAIAGNLLSLIAHNTSSTGMLEVYLKSRFKGDQAKISGCRKWIQTMTGHYSAAASFMEESIQEAFQTWKVSVLDIRFSKVDWDVEMPDLETFYSRVPAKELGRSDIVRMINWHKQKDGDNEELDVFSGTMHAESVLLLMVLMARTGYGEYLPPGTAEMAFGIRPEYLGVSKKCCPVCKVVVSVVEDCLDIRIHKSGSHSTYDACSLPPWTPRVYAERIISSVERDVTSKLIVPHGERLRATFRKARGSGRCTPSAREIEDKDAKEKIMETNKMVVEKIDDPDFIDWVGNCWSTINDEGEASLDGR